MRKKFCLLLLVLFLLALSGCKQEADQPVDNPVEFYYQTDTMQYGSETGLIDKEIRQISQPQDLFALMQLYLQGPQSETLRLPMPTGTRCLQVVNTEDAVEIVMGNEFSDLSGTQLTIAISCIAKTMFQFPQIHKIRIRAQDALLDQQEAIVLSDSDIILLDDGAMAGNYQLTLYFADEANRYLLPNTRIVSEEEVQDLPEYLIRQLIRGPEENESYAVLPEGTMLLDVSMEGATCIVDFSAEFLVNRPTTAGKERMAIFSVVNTLTELDTIDSVQILTEGESLSQYVYLDLSQPLLRDETLIGPVRGGVNEFDATLCLPMPGRDSLLPCPQRLKATASRTPAEMVVEALSNYSGQTQCVSLLPPELQVLSVKEQEGNYTVDFSEDPLKNCNSEQEQMLCLQSIVLSLCHSVAQGTVQIEVNGTPLDQIYPNIGAIEPDASYLAE